LQNDFNETLKIKSIGKTIYNKSIHLIKFRNNLSANEGGILFTGMHHAREPVSGLMNINLILRILHEYYHNKNSYIKELIKSRNIYFIPIINVDGFIRNNEIYESTKKFGMARKNRRISHQCMEYINYYLIISEMDGVDLNRNYGYKFAHDNSGSSNLLCNEDYRGEKAFSEPETQAMKEFIEKHTNNIKVALNYHSFGNLLITPFNYETKENSNLEKNFPRYFRLYKEFSSEGGFPPLDLLGNGQQTIG
jgi:hypothetical protein